MTYNYTVDGKDDKFHWADYVVFIISLCFSMGIGVYFAVVAYVRKNNTSEEFLLGSKGVHWLPAGMSLLVSILNAGFVIGIPAEIYYSGSYYVWFAGGLFIMTVVVIVFFLPTFHRMNITSAYEYFDLRYKFKPLRIVVSVAFLLNMLLLLGVVLYIPALAVNEVTGIKMWILVVTTGGACTLYTTLGGIKAVVWTDLMQSVIMIVGMIMLVIQGTIEVGSVSTVKDRVDDAGRLDFFEFDPDPRVRHTFWTQTIGWGIIMISMYGSSQISIQRYLAMKNMRYSQLSLMIVFVMGCVLLGLVVVTGYVMYAYYVNCDPILEGRIDKPDQIVPRFLMDVMGHMHGLPGLFLAAVFSAALSTVSSALNSMSAVILEDFIRPVYKNLTSSGAMWISKGLALVLGGLTIALSFAAEYMGDRVVQIPATIWGALAAPILGAFVLGLFVSWSTGPGTLVGTSLGLILGCWLSIGGVYEGAKPPILPPLGMKCPIIPPSPPDSLDDPLQDFYDISYTWYGLITLTTTVIFGLLSSLVHIFVTNRSIFEVSREVDMTLMFQGFDGACRRLPEPEADGDMEMKGHQNPAFDNIGETKQAY